MREVSVAGVAAWPGIFPAVSRLVPATLVAALCVACGQADGRAGGLSVDTLDDGRVVVANADPAGTVPLRFVEEFRVGSVEGSEADAFGNVSALAASQHGVVYVGDHTTGDVRAFTHDGDFLRLMAGRGDGPDEVPASGFPMGLLWQAPNRLWIGASPRLISVDSMGHSGVSRRDLLGASAWQGRGDTLGGIYMVRHQLDPSSLWTNEVIEKLKVSAEGAVSPLGRVRLGTQRMMVRRVVNYPNGARGTILDDPPMASRVTWDADPSGDVWLARTDSYRLHRVTMDGDTVRTVELARTPTPLSGGERDSILQEWPNLGAAELPEHKPLIRDLRVGRNGWLWVRLRASTPAADAWDVFDRCGRHLGSATPPVPLDVNPWLPAAGATILAVTKDALDIEYVVRLRLERPDGTPVTPAECTF